MVLRSQLHPAMATSERQTYRLVGSEYHPGQGKMGGVTHARLENVGTGTLRDYCFRSELKLQEVAFESQTPESLSTEGGHCCLMNPDTFEQTEIADGTLDPRCPPSVRRRAPSGGIARPPAGVGGLQYAQPTHQQADSNFKTAKLERTEVLVPQFVKTGDVIGLHVETLKSMPGRMPGPELNKRERSGTLCRSSPERKPTLPDLALATTPNWKGFCRTITILC